MDRQTDGQMDKQTNKQKSPVFYRTASPSEPLPCFLSLQSTIVQSRATVIADHILPLGDLLSPRRSVEARNASKLLKVSTKCKYHSLSAT